MPIYNLFSKRMKTERGEILDVYQYNNFDNNLKIKIIHIIKDYFSDYYISEEYYQKIISILCREYGVFELTRRYGNKYEHLFNYFLSETDTEKALNVVELCFQFIENSARSDNRFSHSERRISSKDAIQELNDRFKEEGFGYKYISGIIIRLTNEITHNEIVKPVLKLLSNKSFKCAEEEYLSAHMHYRKLENKECISDCLKAFESTMKIICKKKEIYC